MITGDVSGVSLLKGGALPPTVYSKHSGHFRPKVANLWTTRAPLCQRTAHAQSVGRSRKWLPGLENRRPGATACSIKKRSPQRLAPLVSLACCLGVLLGKELQTRREQCSARREPDLPQASSLVVVQATGCHESQQMAGSELRIGPDLAFLQPARSRGTHPRCR